MFTVSHDKVATVIMSHPYRSFPSAPCTQAGLRALKRDREVKERSERGKNGDEEEERERDERCLNALLKVSKRLAHCHPHIYLFIFLYIVIHPIH